LNIDLQQQRELAAHGIFRTGSCLIDIEKGFKIALHDKLPDAPLSPFYLNLRQTGIKGGTLEQGHIDDIGKSMYLLGTEHGLFSQGRATCSIPAAGDPYLAVIMKLAAQDGLKIDRFFLEKVDRSGKRFIRLAQQSVAVWKDVLMIDDLVTSITTKRLAIQPITQMRGGVSVLLVFLNRSTTASAKLAEIGVRLHAVWEFEDLMEWALGQQYLTRKQYEVIIEYPTILESYKQSVGYID
jgi:orotate phosphoribosyltransferase